MRFLFLLGLLIVAVVAGILLVEELPERGRAVKEQKAIASSLSSVSLDRGTPTNPRQRENVFKEQQVVTIEVFETSSGNPVPNISLFADDGRSIRYLGLTNERGTLVAQVKDRGTVREVIVRNKNFASKAFFLPSGLERIHTLWLKKGASIIGRVYFPNKGHAGSGANVFAWPMSRPPLLESFLNFVNQQPSDLHFATTNSDGRFELSGLDEKETYTVMATEHGFLSDLSGLEAKPSLVEVSLDVYPIFGAVVRLRDPDQRIPNQKIPDSAVRFGRSGQGDIEPLSPDDPRPLLAGLPNAKEQYDKFDFPLYYLRKDGRTGSFTHHLQVNFPGYERVSAGIEFTDITGGVEEQSIYLQPLGKGFGNLEIIFRDFLPTPYPNREQLALGDFLLHRKGDDKRLNYLYSVVDFMTPLRLQGLPVGEYQYSFILKDRIAIGLEGYDFLHGEVTITQDSPALIELDLSSLGAVQIELRREDGNLWNGLAVFRLYRERPRRIVGYRFSRGPYVLRGLPMGEYSIQVLKPRFTRESNLSNFEKFPIKGKSLLHASIVIRK